MSINQDVSVYVSGQLGKQVGNGECFTLADEALQKAKAKSASDYGKITANADYRWGNAVNLQKLIPGDIIQFRDYKVTITTVTKTRKTKSGGGWEEETSTQTQTESRPHHTAIVGSVGKNGIVSVFEQNVGTGSGKRKTQKNTLYFKTYKEPESVKTKGKTTVTVNKSVKVDGKFWLYRPQPNKP